MKNSELPPHPIFNRPPRAVFTVTARDILIVMALIGVVFLLLRLRTPKVVVESAQTRALSDARQIALALTLYAEDHVGKYPSYTLQDGKPTTTPVTDSNTAFAQLFPDYLRAEQAFWVPGSKFCNTAPPDEIIDARPLDVPVNTLKKGENEWAYVPGFTTASDPGLPIIASGFADPALHTYSRDHDQKGGVWNGKGAIVIRVDSSGTMAPVDQGDMTVHGHNGTASTGDIFTTSNAAKGWLDTSNAVVNPK